jgi:hypothetical protein
VATRLETEMQAGRPIALLPIILTEVLMGFRSDLSFWRAWKVLRRVPCLPLSTETHRDAALLYRRLRRAGVTVRGVVDCVIAQSCIEHQGHLLTLDRDYRKIAARTRLKVLEL